MFFHLSLLCFLFCWSEVYASVCVPASLQCIGEEWRKERVWLFLATIPSLHPPHPACYLSH